MIESENVLLEGTVTRAIDNVELEREARRLHELGMSLIPVGRNKRPLLEWKKYQEKPADLREVLKWISLEGFVGFGVVTGKVSGYVVVDIDVKDGSIPRADVLIDDGLPVTLDELRTAPVSMTGGGGCHIWFKCPDENIPRNATNVVRGDGYAVDFRGEGGYVVVPPTMHSSGNRYVWNKATPDVGDARQLPDGLAAFLSKGKQKESEQPQTVTEHAKEFLTKESFIQPGTKHDTLVRLAGKLMRAYDFSADVLADVLETFLRRHRHPDDTEDVPFENIQRIARDVWKRVNSGEWQGAPLKGAVLLPIDKNSIFEGLLRGPIEGVRVGMDGIDDVGGLVSGLTVIAARPGVGKTTYMAQLTNALLEAKLRVGVLSSEIPPRLWLGWMIAATLNSFSRGLLSSNSSFTTKQWLICPLLSYEYEISS